MRLRKCLLLSRNKITLIQTYYNEPIHLERCVERWNYFVNDLEIILIDDGSKKYPALDILRTKTFRSNINLSLYAVNDDIGFNSHGCRNLGAQVASGDWLLYLDIDYTIQPSELLMLSNADLTFDWYTLTAKPEWKREARYKALNQFFIRKDFYRASGGYDESFVRWHMGDRQFLQSLEDASPSKHLDDVVLTCWRGGRKGIIDDTLDRPIYDDERMIFYTSRFDPHKVVRTDKKINFEWTKLL